MFKRLLLKLFGKIDILYAAVWIPLLMDGIRIELDRVNDFKKLVLSTIIPNIDMDVLTLDDNIRKYGLQHVNYLPGVTDLHKIDFCIEAAALSGYSGPAWLQEQLQKAGFMFYVHPLPLATNPNLIPGYLVVGTHPTGGSYAYTSNPDYWPFYYILSPFADRIALVSELSPYTIYSFAIIRKLIINLKFQRDWIILQVDYAEYLEGSKYLDGTWYLDGAGTPV